jgi:hypothetical protein
MAEAKYVEYRTGDDLDMATVYNMEIRRLLRLIKLELENKETKI